MIPDSLPERFFRHEYSRLVAILSRRMGVRHIEAIEDAVQSALAVGLETWKAAPLPENPTAWLYRVAFNRLTGELRKESRRLKILKSQAEIIVPADSPDSAEAAENEIADDILRMLFFCCDSALPVESQLVIALKALCGFDVREIALRLFISEANVYKRLGRARSQLKKTGRRTGDMDAGEQVQRLPAVHQVLYVLFTEGHLSTHIDFSLRNDLCLEAIRLLELLAGSPAGATPETAALLALMHLHTARNAARLDGWGGLVLLEDQDRGLWDRKLIHSGLQWLELSAQGDRFSRFHAEAAIAAEHCLAPSFAETRWDRIVHNYDLLIAVAPSAILQLNRAVAIAEASTAADGLAALEHVLPPSWLAASYLWLTVLADLHFRNGAPEIAGRYAAMAEQAAPNRAIKKLLQGRFGKYRPSDRRDANPV